jgi:hypothetical protein
MPQSSRWIRAARLCPAGSTFPGGLEDDAIENTGRNISDKWFERPGVRD